MKHVPNLITALRLILVPVVWRLFWQGQYDWGLAIGVVATASDAIDGWVARKFSATSKIGALMDPVADKLLVAGTYFILGYRLEIPNWIVWIILGRDIFILLFAAAAWAFTNIRDFPPSRWGKLSTLIQILTLLVILANRVNGMTIAYDTERFMIRLCAAMTIWSATHYSWLAFNRLRRQN